MLGTLLPGRPARAKELPNEDLRRLLHGEVVHVPLDLDLPKGDYFGGISYALMPVPVADVMGVLLDPAAYTSILPLTLEARIIGKSGDDPKLFLKQGGKLGTASYVLVVQRESMGLVRFWLDPTEPHEIGDCWGYFRVQPWGKRMSLLTYAALVHLDAGLVKLLFAEKIRSYALSTPGLVRAYVHAHQGHPAPTSHER